MGRLDAIERTSGSSNAIIAKQFLDELEVAFGEMLEGFGDLISSFNIAHWRVLMGVWEKDGKITQTEAKQAISTLPGFQSDKARRALVKQLSQAGLIVKTLDPNDERRVILSLTGRAIERIEAYLNTVLAKINDFHSN